MAFDEDELNKQVREHAWNWFALHAGRRMQSFNFFLIATAFLIAGYASLLDKRPVPAVAVALLGAWVAFWFHRLDMRTRQLLDAGEKVLEIDQARLAERTGIPDLNILNCVKRTKRGASTYKTVIGMIEWSILVAFLVGVAFAGLVAVCPRA
jgi:hypothetical protein